MKIHFVFDPTRLSLLDMAGLEEMQLDGKEMRKRDQLNMMARFLVDGDGKPVATETAVKVVGNLTGDQLAEAIAGFAKVVEEVGKSQIPPE